jgi:pyroglutamyl-peptidase
MPGSSCRDKEGEGRAVRTDRALTVLITGFGPFPGAPCNPTGALVAKLLHRRRPALADVRLIGHVFPASYAAVDRQLPKLLTRYAPDALLMFGLAARRQQLSVETRARNAVSAVFPDAARSSGHLTSIVAGGPPALPFGPHIGHLVSAAQSRGVFAYLSRDAGRYVCNYLCWRALEHGPKPAAFVHVPKLSGKRPIGRMRRRRRPSLDDLVHGGEAILVALVAAAHRHR